MVYLFTQCARVHKLAECGRGVGGCGANCTLKTPRIRLLRRDALQRFILDTADAKLPPRTRPNAHDAHDVMYTTRYTRRMHDALHAIILHLKPIKTSAPASYSVGVLWSNIVFISNRFERLAREFVIE